MNILNDPLGVLVVGAAAAAAILLVLWLYKSLQNPAKSQAFDAAIALQLGGSELDIDTALNQTQAPKLSPFKDWFGYWLDQFERAGQRPSDDTTPGRIAIGSGVLFAALIWVGMGELPAAFLGLPLGPIAVKAWTGNGLRKRATAMEKQLPSLLSGLRSNLQAGATPQGAIVQVAADMPSPLGDELRLLRHELAVSTSLEVALKRLAERVPSREMQFLVASIEIAVRSGANLDPQLATIEEIVAQRTRIRGKLRAAVAQVKPTKALAYGAPPLLFVVNGLRNADNRSYWFGNGVIMLVVACTLYAVGGYVIRIMVKSVENT